MKVPFGIGADIVRLKRATRNDEQPQEDPQSHSEERQPRRRQLPPPSVPMGVARIFLAEASDENGVPMLRHWRGAWWRWKGPHWKEAEPKLVRRLLYAFTEHAVYATADGMSPWCPTRKKIDDLVDALTGVCLLPNSTEQPGWLDDRGNVGTIVSVKNGLLDLEQRRLIPHSPLFFNITSVDIDYSPKAQIPRQWRKFLKTLWPHDSQSRKALAEWFGYTISGRLDLQKILLLIGPTRAGKGIIARILGALIGPKNVAGPTLSSLGGDFGLAPLIGKPLAIISDARLSGRHGSVVVERLLSISGEDYLTVNIKYREQWTGRLPCRLFVISNELPEFGDASVAIVGRFLVLALSRSWLGEEDIELELRLRSQLPGVLNWALLGLAHLEKKCRFTQPRSSDDAIATLRDLASPVRGFVRERCELNPDHQVLVDDLYAAYREWADESGHPRIAKPTFGRNLRAALPRVRLAQQRCGEARIRVYVGIRLKRPEPV